MMVSREVFPTMEGVEHKYVVTDLGIRLHCVTMGTGPPVLLLHGFPDFWYGYRYQIPALAAAGFSVIVPDIRGSGESDAPESPQKYTFFDIVADIVGLLGALNINEKVFVVGHDLGATYAMLLMMLRPDLVSAVVDMGFLAVPWRVPTTGADIYRLAFGEECYINVFQEPGRAEALFAKEKTTYVLKSFLTRWHEDPQMRIPKVYSDDEEAQRPLPDWLTSEDLQYYADTFARTGFASSLNQYRNLARSAELCAAWRGKTLEAPVLLITATHDIPLSKFFPSSREEYFASYKDIIPHLQDVKVVNSGHFLQQEQHGEVNKLIIEFFTTFLPSK